jgi:hypothetical protein
MHDKWYFFVSLRRARMACLKRYEGTTQTISILVIAILHLVPIHKYGIP